MAESCNWKILWYLRMSVSSYQSWHPMIYFSAHSWSLSLNEGGTKFCKNFDEYWLGWTIRTKVQSSVYCFLPQLILRLDNSKFLYLSYLGQWSTLVKSSKCNSKILFWRDTLMLVPFSNFRFWSSTPLPSNSCVIISMQLMEENSQDRSQLP